MDCVPIPNGIVCLPSDRISLAPWGSHVWVELHPYLGPEFYRSEYTHLVIESPSRKTWRAFESWQASNRKEVA